MRGIGAFHLLRLPRLLCFLLMAAAVALPSRAHDPLESWTAAIVHPDALELVVTMAQFSAVKLLDPAGKFPAFTVENFVKYRPQLEKAGAVLFAITSIKAPVAPRRVEVELTEENDISFKIVYPRPATGLLIFDALFLKKLGDGFGGMIEATESGGRQLGWDQINSESTTLVVMLPAAKAPPAKK